jgi:predicted NBD/HSP70 family sugar kinase
MIAAVDVGGTKTLLAVFNEDGKIVERRRFATPKKYADFCRQLADNVAGLSTKKFTAVAAAFPGKIIRATGVVHAFGNLDWHDVHVRQLLEKIFGKNTRIAIENDSKLAGLSEARALGSKYERVLYVTIGTGISNALVVNGKLDPELIDSEGGQMLFHFEGKLQNWEDFASGRAIKSHYGKHARDITDSATWREITERIGIGVVNLCSVIEPQAVVIGGGVGNHFDRFGEMLKAYVRKHLSDLTDQPVILPAKHAEEAVIYGCYEYLKQSPA